MNTAEQIENAKAALGFHPDSDTNIADEISRIRDEGRGHFHTVTKQLDVIAELRRQIATYKEDQRVSSEAYNFLHGQYRRVRDSLDSLLSLGEAEGFGQSAHRRRLLEGLPAQPNPAPKPSAAPSAFDSHYL